MTGERSFRKELGEGPGSIDADRVGALILMMENEIYDRKTHRGEIDIGEGVKIKYWRAKRGQWYWHRVSANGKVTGVGGEGYYSRWNVRRAIKSWMKT